MNLRKMMSAKPSEFFRSLTHFSPDRSYDESLFRFHFPLSNGEAFVSYKILPDRQVTGLLSLPQMEVLVEFNDVPEADKLIFMKQFDLAFRRGGG